MWGSDSLWGISGKLSPPEARRDQGDPGPCPQGEGPRSPNLQRGLTHHASQDTGQRHQGTQFCAVASHGAGSESRRR